MSTPARFSDGQYKNWLKCSQSLIIMKEALHDYIDSEVKKLHLDITQKVSSSPCGSSTGNQCGSCSSKNIKQTGGKHGNWTINCKNSICDKWLREILAVHADPHSPTINWKNADISKWPTDCYHVAKIFMPKGQDKTTKMPEDLDAPAVLSLFYYCNWFRTDLPNTQMLSNLIDIRNRVLHSGDLSVADGDKDSWIDLMIQLLSDLNIHSDAQAELQMLKKEDIDINFRETEIKVFQRMASGLVSDFTTVKGDMVSLQNVQSDLSKDVERLSDNTTETTTNMDTLNFDVQEIRKSLDGLKIISDKMVSFFDKNPDILDKEITETIRNIGTDVQNQQKELSDIKVRILSLEMQMEKNQEETKKQIEEIKKSQEETKQEVEGIKRRHVADEEQMENDEQLYLQNEVPRKRRPETDGLKQLKNQTEDKLDTLRRLKCILTKQAEDAKKLLERKRSIVIKGNPGEGKTTTALHLIDDKMYENKRIVLNYPRDWKKVDTDWVDIIILEDIFGQFDLDLDRLKEWMVYLPTIEEHVDAEKLRVIVTTRVDILSKASANLGSLKLFSDDLSLTLCSEQLKDSEKMSILNRELKRHKRNMEECEKEKCISNFTGLIGFPQCCLLFAGDGKSFDRGPEFFRSPEKFFVENITKLEPSRFLSLAFLFCNGELWEENLSLETMPESSKDLLMELARNLGISETEQPITLLRDAYVNFLELYVVKSTSFDREACIQFTHATVFEAVGQVLGDHWPAMVVKYSDSEYLYQRTYTAKAKDGNSKNMLIPVYLYGLLAERTVHDVIERGLVQSIVKHSALKQHDFLKKLKCELNKCNRINNFFMAKSDHFDHLEHWSEGECSTFMQYILQSDEDVVKLVYTQLLEFLTCSHNNNSSNCWQCEEKQGLLELALYYHHFQIADKLITMKACYTHVSLCNAAKHGDFIRVQTIVEILKRSRVFNPVCKEAKYALCRAYISGNQSLIDLLIKEGIILDSRHVVDAIQHGDMNVLMKVVEHLKCHKRWKPHLEQHVNPYFKIETNSYLNALHIAYINEKFDMADYLLRNEVKVSLYMLVSVSVSGSQQAVSRVIQNLKDTDNWNPKRDAASKALKNAYSHEKYDVCDLLVQEGVSLTMKNLPAVIKRFIVSLETVKKEIQHLKDTDNWNPKCDAASNALEYAYRLQKYDVCYLLVQEGVSLTMKNIPAVTEGPNVSLETVKKVIQNLKDTDNWNPKCDAASEALEYAYSDENYDVCDLLVQEGVSLTMKNLPAVTMGLSLETVKKAIQHLKDTDNWNPKCDAASEALENSYCHEKYDVCDLLVQEGVSLTMKNLPAVTMGLSLETVKKAIQHLKDTDNWNPKCDAASEALENSYCHEKYDVCDLLVQEGVSLTMKNLPAVTIGLSLETVKKAIQHLKDTDNWNPKCDTASQALEIAYSHEKYDVCDLLVQEGVSLTMKILPAVIMGFNVSLESVKKAIQHLKDTDNWNPKCDTASQALENAYSHEKYDVCDLLVQEGVSLTMKILPAFTNDYDMSLEYVKKAIQNLKDTDNWNPKCDAASQALGNACRYGNYDVCDLLVQEGVSLTMKILPVVIMGFNVSLESVKKEIQHLKDTDNWNPKCDTASEALENAYRHQKYDVCDLLVQEGVSLTMKNLPVFTNDYEVSLEYVKKAIQNLKDTDNWNPKCDAASQALGNAYRYGIYDVCDLLVQEGVSLTMKILPAFTNDYDMSLEYVKKAIQNLKDTNNWNPKCDAASEALENAYSHEKYDVCDLLVQEGVSLTMKNLPAVTMGLSLETVQKAIQHLKDTDNWNPKCDTASQALENAYSHEKYDVCDLLVQEGVSLTMKSLPAFTMAFDVSLETVQKAIQHLKDTDNWNPKCDAASEALENAYICCEKFDVCDLLVQEGVSLTRNNLLADIVEIDVPVIIEDC